MAPPPALSDAGLTPRGTFAAWLAIAGACVLVTLSSPVQRVDLALLDAQFGALRAIGPKPVAHDVVLVGVDEATLAAFPEPIALWHRHLAQILDGLAAARPRAVGIDVELPERSFDFVRSGLDAELLRSINGLKAVAPVVAALGVDAGGRPKPVHLPFLAALGAEGAGFAHWPLDDDGAVRRFDERSLSADGTPVPTFGGVLARRLGAATPAGIVDFALGPPFGYVPAHDVAAWAAAGDSRRLEEAFRDRVVLVGGVLPFVDRHRVPVTLAAWETGADGESPLTAPGLVLHAQALRALLGPGLVAPAPPVVALALAVLGSALWFGFARLRTGIALFAAIAVALVAGSMWMLYRGVHVPVAGAMLAAVTASALRVGFEAWFNRRQRQRLRRSFAGAVSPNVLDLILRGELESALGSGRRMVCVMFGDIRNFTPLSETADPDWVVALLNRYFTRITAAAHRFGGTVDNFRGDGIMVVFGAPQATPEPCRDGFRAARAMFEEVEALNRELVAEGAAPIHIGLSLAYGEAVVGRIGAAERNEYTAIGDIANVSARLEGLTKEVGYPLVLNAAAAAAIPDATFDDLGERVLKGHSPVRAYGWPARVVAAAELAA